MKRYFVLLFLLLSPLLFAQQAPVKANDQSRYHSNSRIFYLWSDEKDAYEPKD